MKSILIIVPAFFLYTVLEWIVHKKNWIRENRQLWSSSWAFLWGSILFVLLFWVIPGEYNAWGDILYAKDAFKHMVLWILGFGVFYSLNGKTLSGSAAAVSWNRKEFYYFCFLNPIIEEILFRGIILMSLLNNFPSIKYEEFFVVISSLLFALFHINYEPSFKFNKYSLWGILIVFIIGNSIGFLVLLTRSLWMSILMHILINFTGAVFFNIRKLKTNNSR